MTFLKFVNTKRPGSTESSPPENGEVFLKDSADILGSDFPNPDRVGCPQRSFLESIAAGKLPLNEITPWMKHLGACSECFRDVAKFRHGFQRRKSFRLAYAAAAMAMLAALTLILLTTHRLGTTNGQEAVLDLRDESRSRGPNPNSGSSKELPKLSLSSHNILIYLPMGAEGSYEVRVIDESGKLAGTATGTGERKGSVTVLPIKLNLSHARPGTYSLILRRDAASTIYKIRID